MALVATTKKGYRGRSAGGLRPRGPRYTYNNILCTAVNTLYTAVVGVRMNYGLSRARASYKILYTVRVRVYTATTAPRMIVTL